MPVVENYNLILLIDYMMFHYSPKYTFLIIYLVIKHSPSICHLSSTNERDKYLSLRNSKSNERDRAIHRDDGSTKEMDHNLNWRALRIRKSFLDRKVPELNLPEKVGDREWREVHFRQK